MMRILVCQSRLLLSFLEGQISVGALKSLTGEPELEPIKASQLLADSLVLCHRPSPCLSARI